jgi:hypothetical protein
MNINCANLTQYSNQAWNFYNFVAMMLPDYPHKIFNDKRINYSLLMETLAMDAPS